MYEIVLLFKCDFAEYVHIFWYPGLILCVEICAVLLYCAMVTYFIYMCCDMFLDPRNYCNVM
jgi:hypothetical protein